MELDLKEVLSVLRKRLWIIIAFVVVGCVAVGIYNVYFTKPIYYATSKLIVNKSSDATGDAKLDLSSLNANIQLINTYKEILKTTAILDKVAAQHPEFGLSSEAINARIDVSSKTQSQVMTVGIRDTSHERAVGIANAVAQVFQVEVPKIMKVDNITILSQAKVAAHPVPISPNTRLNFTIAVVASLLISIGFILFLEYMDDSIRREKDVEQILGVPVLGTIKKIKKKDLAESKKASYQRVPGGEKSYAGSSS